MYNVIKNIFKFIFRITEKEVTVEFELAINLYNFAKENLKNRFRITGDHIAAALLDPAQKNKQFIDNHLPVNTTRQSLLEQKLREFNIYEVSSTPLNMTLDNIGLLSEFDDIVETCDNLNLNAEISKYFATKSNQYRENITLLEWWKMHRDEFIILSKLAQIYLGIPATSSSAEMAFSSAGNFMTSRRSNLQPSRLNKLCTERNVLLK